MSNSEPYIFRLSQEIIDEIIDSCAAADERQGRTIKSCALVCRSFCPRCQMHMFSTIKFHSDTHTVGERLRRIERFFDILQHRPQIARYVHELHLTIAFGDNIWMSEDPKFLQIMELIRQLNSAVQKLTIVDFGHRPQFDNILSLKQGFWEPYIAAFITSLEIRLMRNVPIDLVANCINLEELILVYAHLDPLATYPAPPSQDLPRIQKLECHFSNDVVRALLKGNTPAFMPYLDFSGLRILKANPDSLGNMKDNQDIINVSSESLQEIEISTEKYRYVSLLNRLDLNVPSLRILKLDVILGWRKEDDDPIVALCSILKTIPSSNNMQTITINFFFGSYYPHNVSPESCLDKDWHSLDSEIKRISSGKLLHFHVHMVYQVYCWDPEVDGEEDVDVDGHEDADVNGDGDEDGDAEADGDEEGGDPHRYIGIAERLQQRCDAIFAKLPEKLLQISFDPNIIVTYSQHVDLSSDSDSE